VLRWFLEQDPLVASQGTRGGIHCSVKHHNLSLEPVPRDQELSWKQLSSVVTPDLKRMLQEQGKADAWDVKVRC